MEEIVTYPAKPTVNTGDEFATAYSIACREDEQDETFYGTVANGSQFAYQSQIRKINDTWMQRHKQGGESTWSEWRVL